MPQAPRLRMPPPGAEDCLSALVSSGDQATFGCASVADPVLVFIELRNPPSPSSADTKLKVFVYQPERPLKSPA